MIIEYNERWSFDTGVDTFALEGEGYTELTVQDLADMISFAHAKKVEKDNEIKKQYANNTSTSNQEKESGQL